MLSIIYPYRNRDLKRLKNSFNSLESQTVPNFEVFLIDYGSNPSVSNAVQNLCKDYRFIQYIFHPTQFQPWNKSKALNSVIKNLDSDFCFVADVDMIFHPAFVENATALQDPRKVIYFQVGFLSPEELEKNDRFEEYNNYRKSTREATGMSLFPVKALQKLRGFDEFYHFWGAEDTDMHVRLKNAGYAIEFHDKKVLLLHQWHPSYRSREKSNLTQDLQIEGIVQLNHQHLKFAEQYQITVANVEDWGICISHADLEALKNTPVEYMLNNERRIIDDFIFGQLTRLKNEIVKVRIRKDPYQNSLKHFAKKKLGKKVPQYYSLKEVNDKFLLHLISFYRDKPYIFSINEDFKKIEMAIKL